MSSRIQSGSPARLLLVSTGNIGNDVLMEVLSAAIEQLAQVFETTSFAELTRDLLIVHE